MEALVTLGYICICIVLFSLAIAIHEWGHFIVALKLGLKVERFSIGFGPAIWKKTYNGVEYRISWIPLGGYVSIPDVDPEGTKALEGSEKAKSESEEVRSKIPAWKELAVAFAGPFMNLVLAAVLAVLLACVPSAQFGEGLPVLDDLNEIGPAARAGLQRGDRVLSVDGHPVASWFELLTEVQLSDGRPVTFVAERAGVTNSYAVTPVQAKGVWDIGAKAAMVPEIGAADPEGVAARAGVLPGDRIVSFAGHDVPYWSDYLDAIDEAGEAGGDLVVARAGERLTLPLKPACTYAYLYVGPFVRPAIVSEPDAGTAAAAAGLKAGDRIVSVGDTPVTCWNDLAEAVQKTEGAESDLAVVRGSETMKLRVTPKKGVSGRYFIQTAFKAESVPATPVVRPGSAAEKAGLAAGDTVVSVNGAKIANWEELEREVHRQGAAEKPLELGVKRGEATVTVRLTAEPKCQYKAFAYGLSAVSCAPWMSHRNPCRQILADGKGIFHILKALVTPKKAKATGKALGGPVQIAQGIYLSIRHDFWSGLGFLRYLNVNLAILNLLPIPVLDGGLILFALIAIVFRRRVPQKIVTTLSMGFMYLLLALMGLLLWRDCSRIVTRQLQNADTPEFVITDHDIAKPDTNAEDR